MAKETGREVNLGGLTRELIDFKKKFGTEEACRERLIEWRWPEGFKCPRCKGTEAYFLTPRKLYQCKGCGYQASLTARTIFDRTRVPLPKWFMLILLMVRQVKGVRLSQFQKAIDINSTKTFWRMLRRIRKHLKWKKRAEKLASLIGSILTGVVR